MSTELSPESLIPNYAPSTKSDMLQQTADIIKAIAEAMQGHTYTTVTRTNFDGYGECHYTVGLHVHGLPELFVGVQPHQGIEVMIAEAVTHLLEVIKHDPTVDIGDELNAYFTYNGRSEYIRAQWADSGHFIYGPGLAANRWYGDERDRVKVVQLLLSAAKGVFPGDEEYDQTLYPQTVLQTDAFGIGHSIPREKRRPTLNMGHISYH